MEWEPVFILGVTGGAMLISAVRNVIDTGRGDRPAAPPAAARRRKRSPEIDDLDERVARLEWLADPATRAVAGQDRLRRGAA